MTDASILTVKVNALLFVSACKKCESPSRYELVCPINPVVIIDADEEEQLLTLMCQAHAERGDKKTEVLTLACSAPNGTLKEEIPVVNTDDRARMIWTNPIEVKMKLIPGEYVFAIGQPGRIDARCWLVVERRSPSHN